VISPHVHVCEQHMPWRWKWLGDVVKLAHVMMEEFIARETWHWVMWPRWRRSRWGLASWLQVWRSSRRLWSEGPYVMVKLEQDLALMDQHNGKKQVRSRSMNQYGHVMIWSGPYHLMIGWCMCCINIKGDGMECARQRYNLGHFILSVKGCVEKCMTRFRIDGHTIKRGKLVCISVI
jgi:hypothetical protein